MSERADSDPDADPAPTTADDRLRNRIRRYFVEHPDASVIEALGGLTLSPDHRDLVAEVRAEHREDSDLPTGEGDLDHLEDDPTPDHQGGSPQDGPTRKFSDDSRDNTPTGDHWASGGAPTSSGRDPEPDPEPETPKSPDPAAHTPPDAGSADTNPGFEAEDPDRHRAHEAFADAIAWFHDQIDRRIDDHDEEGEHPDRPTTAREYFHEQRGWTDDTIGDARLGWAPSSRTGLLDHLMREGYDREAILGTGLFTQDLRPLWQGRYVLPYFAPDGQPV